MCSVVLRDSFFPDLHGKFPIDLPCAQCRSEFALSVQFDFVLLEVEFEIFSRS